MAEENAQCAFILRIKRLGIAKQFPMAEENVQCAFILPIKRLGIAKQFPMTEQNALRASLFSHVTSRNCAAISYDIKKIPTVSQRLGSLITKEPEIHTLWIATI